MPSGRDDHRTCLRFVFLLITRMTSWLRLSRREEAWITAEILLLRHQFAVLQRQQLRRPNLDWADRAWIATLLAVMPKARRHELRLLVNPGHELHRVLRRRLPGHRRHYRAHGRAGAEDERDLRAPPPARRPP